jgi:hypothetical protein
MWYREIFRKRRLHFLWSLQFEILGICNKRASLLVLKMVDVFQMTPDRSRLNCIATSSANQHAVIVSVVE